MNKPLVGLILAVAASSPNILNKSTNPGDFYGHTAVNTYSKINFDYDNTLCLPITQNPCAYRELRRGIGLLPNNFSSAEAADFIALGYIEPLGEGIIVGL